MNYRKRVSWSLRKIAKQDKEACCAKIEIEHLGKLTDRGTGYCGRREHHEYQLYLALEDIDHSKTKILNPQTNGICTGFHKTMQDEFHVVTFFKKSI